MEFKKLEIKQEGSWLKRKLALPHTRKTLIYMLIGAIGALVYYYFAEDKALSEFTVGEILKTMAFGIFLGFFVTNSPCARGRC